MSGNPEAPLILSLSKDPLVLSLSKDPLILSSRSARMKRSKDPPC